MTVLLTRGFTGLAAAAAESCIHTWQHSATTWLTGALQVSLKSLIVCSFMSTGVVF